jgi:hypothetical protein
MHDDPGHRSRARHAGGPLSGILLGAALGVSAFLAAHHFLGGPGRPGEAAAPPDGFRTGSAATAPVTVLTGALGPGVEAVLLPLRDDGAPTEQDGALLDAALYPGEAPRQWWRLAVSNRGAAPFAMDLRPGALVRVDGSGGRSGSLDLAAALDARRPRLPRHRAFGLAAAGAGARRLEVPPGGHARVLVAFPGARADAAIPVRVEAAGASLVPREATSESLRTALATGRLDELRPASRDAAAAPGAASPAPGTDR